MEIKIFNYLPDEAHFIRDTVFIKEQGFAKEYDEIDDIANHIVIYENNVPLGTCRVFWNSTENGYHVGRIAVLKESRNKGYGSILVKEAIKLTKSLGGNVLRLGSQLHAINFYEQLGFKRDGENFLDEGQPHTPMAINFDK